MAEQTQAARILELLSEFRILTVEQFCELLGSSGQMTRRWLRQLKTAKQIRELTRKSKGRGRPAPAFCRTEDNFKAHLVEHQLALNSLRLSLHLLSGYESQFLAHSSTDLRMKIPTAPPPAPYQTIIPDGVLSLSNEQKSLLFFVEVDMGTEPLKAKRNGATDFLEKLDAYRVYFATEGYKAFEKRFSCAFVGFRLLVVTNTAPRLKSLSAFVETEEFCEFVWLTSLKALQERGWASKIWSVGGIPRPLEAILTKS